MTPATSAEGIGLLREPHDALAGMIADSAAPREVNAWWHSLDRAARHRLAKERPDLVGHCDGIPTLARDEANRRLLEAELDGGGDRPGLEELRKRIVGLDRVTGLCYFLLGFGGGLDDEVLLALGDPDSSRRTVVFVPGTGDLDRAMTMARDVHEADPTEETAMVFWLGYAAPGNAILEPPSLTYAKDASQVLARFLDGLAAVNGVPDYTVSAVVGHSRGTTVVAVPVRDGDRLRQGPDTTAGFGSRVFETDAGGQDPFTLHDGFWDEGNAARDSLAGVIAGGGR